MELTEDEIIEKYIRKHCVAWEMHRHQMITNGRVSCEYIVIKQKSELRKFQRNRNFLNGLNYGERSILCICIHVYRIYDGNDADNLFSKWLH